MFRIVRMDISARIKERMLSLGIKGVDITKATGMSSGGVSQWVNGLSKPNGERLLSLSKVLKCQPDWLLYGKGELSEYSNITHAPPIKRMIPVISWVQAGELCESNILELHEGDEWLPCPSNASEKTYGLRVKGDSMTSPHRGERSYPEGIVIYVDPEAELTSGRRVIAKSNSSDEATFKSYIEDNGVKYLIPINPQFPTIPMTSDVHVCGVIIGSYWPE